MPIYEYVCRACQQRFEAIVRGSDVPGCPACGAMDLERLISSFAVDSPGTRKLGLKAVQQQNAATTREKASADYNYDRKRAANSTGVWHRGARFPRWSR
jgi:putative FmdB family regulatory protein